LYPRLWNRWLNPIALEPIPRIRLLNNSAANSLAVNQDEIVSPELGVGEHYQRHKNERETAPAKAAVQFPQC